MGTGKIYILSTAIIFGGFLFWYRPITQTPHDQSPEDFHENTLSRATPTSSPESLFETATITQDQKHASSEPETNDATVVTEFTELSPVPADPESTDPYLAATGEHADEVNLAVAPCTDSCVGPETIAMQASGYFAEQVNAEGLRERALLDGAIDPNADLGIPLTDQSDTPPPPTELGEYIVIDNL